MPGFRCRTIFFALALASATSACTGSGSDARPTASAGASASGDPLGGLVTAESGDKPVPIDVTQACADPAELLRAATISHTAVTAALGSHRARFQSTVEIRDGDTVLDSLTVRTTLEQSDTGELRAVLDNSADYGRVAIFTGGQLYLAPRYGKYHRRAPETPEEPGELGDQIFAELGAHLELIASGIAVQPAGDGERAGRRGRKVAVSASSGKAATGDAPAGDSAWRDTVRVLEADGELLLDDETGIPLAATITARIAARRDGRELVMTLSLEHGIDDIGAAVTVEPPPAERQVATPLRSSELSQRETLLRGIAPPSRSQSPAPRGGKP